MNQRLETIKQSNPKAAEREDVRDIATDIDRYAEIAGLASSPAGKILLGALTQDAADALTAIMLGYKMMPDIELRGLAARLEARVGLIRSLNNAPTNLELAEAVLSEMTKG